MSILGTAGGDKSVLKNKKQFRNGTAWHNFLILWEDKSVKICYNIHGQNGMPTIYGNRFGGASIRHSSVPGTGLSGLRETHSSVLTGNTKSRTENKRGIADSRFG